MNNLNKELEEKLAAIVCVKENTMDAVIKLRLETEDDLKKVCTLRTMTHDPIVVYGASNSEMFVDALELGADLCIPDDMGERERIVRTNRLLERC